MKVIHYVFAVQILVVSAVNPVVAEEKTGPGLFEYYACVNCHGTEGGKPVSKAVPSLAGKSADEIYTKAQKILLGEGATSESEIMHTAFYSPSQCDQPPSQDELRMISNWLASK